MSENVQKTLRDSAALRWLALILLAGAMFCSYIFMDILSPIKDLMWDTKGWDSTAFGTMQGSETFLNVFVFFLIFAGIILDKMGVRFTAILSGAVMLVGATINWYALTDMFAGSNLEVWFNEHLNYIPGFDELGVSPFYKGMPASAKFSAIGFMIFGCGVEMAGITVSRGIVKWFKGREMALAMGSEMALARLGVATCMIFSPMFARLGGEVSVSRSVAFGVVLLMIALIMFIVYIVCLKLYSKQTLFPDSSVNKMFFNSACSAQDTDIPCPSHTFFAYFSDPSLHSFPVSTDSGRYDGSGSCFLPHSLNASCSCLR